MNNQLYHTDRVDERPDAISNTAETSEADIPITPPPDPGEGGPMDGGSGIDNGDIPVIPLPDPDGGDPVDSDNRSFPPIFRPVFPGDTDGSVIVIPGITSPCFNCTATSFGRMRFLNAPTGCQPFYVYPDDWMVTNGLTNGDTISYAQFVSGTQAVIISGANRCVYIQKSAQMSASSSMTTTIINAVSGLGIMGISDIFCNAPLGNSCLCTCNLPQNLGPFDMSIENQSNSYTTFTNVRYRGVASYTSLYPGWYQLYIARTGAFPSTYVATAAANVSVNVSYALRIFNALNATKGLRAMVVSN